MNESAAAIAVDPDIQGGTPCFAGTRVPVKALFDAVAHGRSVDYFLSQFASVTAGQLREVLQQAERLVSEDARRPHAA